MKLVGVSNAVLAASAPIAVIGGAGYILWSWRRAVRARAAHAAGATRAADAPVSLVAAPAAPATADRRPA